MYQDLIKPLAIDIKNFLLDTLFPISCLSCGEEGAFVCADCKSTMEKLQHQRCIVCQKNAPFGLTHSACQTPQGADGLISFYNYHDEKVSKILIAGKYNFIPKVYEILGRMITAELQSNFLISQFQNFYLVPIPLHGSRKRWRGFNQAEVLCRTLSAQLGLPKVDALIRKKITKTQKDLKKEGRLKNVSDAFALSPLFSRRSDEASAKSDKEGVSLSADSSDVALAKLEASAKVEGSSFVLIDDVTTTGATLQEAAKILKRHGAAKVICLTVARD